VLAKDQTALKIAFVVVLTLLLIGNVVLTHNLLTKPYPGLNDFMSRWEGARSFWIDGLNPYGEQASLNIQMQIFGRPIVEGEDPGYFVYPFYVAFLLLPLVFVNYAWASAIWMVILEACLIIALLLALDLFRWRPRPILMAMLVLWTIVQYYGARGLLLGQVGIVVYLFEALTLWALAKEQDRLAGVALALSTLKPQMGFLLIPFLLLWGLRVRRWTFVAAFIVSMLVLVSASFLFQPSWLGDWIAQMRLYPQYTAAAYSDTGSPVWIVTQHYLGLGSVGEWIVNLLFLAPMLWGWFTVLIERRDERFMWALMLTLTVTHLVALRTATTHFVVFTIPLVFYLKLLSRRRSGNLWVALILIALTIVPWLHFLITVQGRDSLEHPALFLPPTFGLFALLLLTRRLWWNAEQPIRPRPEATLLLQPVEVMR
jgi:hypothetical protein